MFTTVLLLNFKVKELWKRRIFSKVKATACNWRFLDMRRLMFVFRCTCSQYVQAITQTKLVVSVALWCRCHSTKSPNTFIIEIGGFLKVESSHEQCNVVIFRKLQGTVFTARCYASAVLAMALCPSVRPSVCLSVTSESSTKTAKRRITQTTSHDSPGTLVFWSQRSPEIRPGLPPTRAPNTGGVGQNRRLSTKNNRLYLENGTR